MDIGRFVKINGMSGENLKKFKEANKKEPADYLDSKISKLNDLYAGIYEIKRQEKDSYLLQQVGWRKEKEERALEESKCTDCYEGEIISAYYYLDIPFITIKEEDKVSEWFFGQVTHFCFAASHFGTNEYFLLSAEKVKSK